MPPLGRPQALLCLTSPPRLCYCSCIGKSLSLKFRLELYNICGIQTTHTFFEVADSQPSRGGKRHKGKKGGGEKSFNNSDVPVRVISE